MVQFLSKEELPRNREKRRIEPLAEACRVEKEKMRKA